MDLHFSRQDFEEIYFKDHQGDYFRSSTTKGLFIALSVGLALLTVAGVYWFYNDSLELIVFACIPVALLAFFYIKACRVLYVWKTQVSNSLDKEEQYEHYQIILSDGSFSLIQNDKETIERWSNFVKATISDEYIFLEGSQNIMIPRKSLKAEDYGELKKVVSEKIK